jgi:UDP-2,3-diacylglucosamine pyrophosphatase LpxH
MPKFAVDDDEFIAVWRSTGRNISATSREMGKRGGDANRKRNRDRLKRLQADGKLPKDEYQVKVSDPSFESFMDARSQMVRGFQKKQNNLDWRKPALLRDIGDEPFILWAGGDPHLDNHGSDIERFIRSFERLSVEDRVFGMNVGDWFDNWLRALAHLFKEGSDPHAGWTIFEHLMKSEHGKAFLFSVCGNHDLWTSAPYDPIDMVHKEIGAIYRRSAGHFIIRCGEHYVKVLTRHGFNGRSQYSNAHAIKRAVTFRQSDADIAIGGHTHISEYRAHTDPASGHVQHLVQLGSFKAYDAFPVDKAFLESEHQPEMWLVIDPQEDRAERERVTVFYDFDRAAAYMDGLRIARAHGSGD